MTKRKPNISPSLIGELFLKPGEDIPYRLILCNTEPTAQIQRVDRTTPDDLVGISGLSGLVLLKPVHPIIKPSEPRKPRSDKGTTRTKKPKQVAPVTDPVTAEHKSRKLASDSLVTKLEIHTAHGKEKQHTFKFGDKEARGSTLKECALDLLDQLGITHIDITWGGKEFVKALREHFTTEDAERICSFLEDKQPEYEPTTS